MKFFFKTLLLCFSETLHIQQSQWFQQISMCRQFMFFQVKCSAKQNYLGYPPFLAKFLKPAVFCVCHSGQRSCLVGGRLLLNRNPTMDQRNHPNNTVSDSSTSLWSISISKGEHVRGFFGFWLDGELCCSLNFSLTYVLVVLNDKKWKVEVAPCTCLCLPYAEEVNLFWSCV